MSRTLVRTVQLSLDMISQIQGMFGTIQNAHDRLGLASIGVSYAVFYRAIHFRSITPEHKDLIEDSWTIWRKTFLHPDMPAAEDPSLNINNRYLLPAWHKKSKKAKGD